MLQKLIEKFHTHRFNKRWNKTMKATASFDPTAPVSHAVDPLFDRNFALSTPAKGFSAF